MSFSVARRSRMIIMAVAAWLLLAGSPAGAQDPGNTGTEPGTGSGTGSGGEEAGAGILLVIIVVSVIFYFLPSLIAVLRWLPGAGAVVVINLFLGWTFIGWVVALAMSLGSKPQRPVVVQPWFYAPPQPPRGYYPGPYPGTAPPPGPPHQQRW